MNIVLGRRFDSLGGQGCRGCVGLLVWLLGSICLLMKYFVCFLLYYLVKLSLYLCVLFIYSFLFFCLYFFLYMSLCGKCQSLHVILRLVLSECSSFWSRLIIIYIHSVIFTCFFLSFILSCLSICFYCLLVFISLFLSLFVVLYLFVYVLFQARLWAMLRCK